MFKGALLRNPETSRSFPWMIVKIGLGAVLG
jgi:hypothetical protein